MPLNVRSLELYPPLPRYHLFRLIVNDFGFLIFIFISYIRLDNSSFKVNNFALTYLLDNAVFKLFFITAKFDSEPAKV